MMSATVQRTTTARNEYRCSFCNRWRHEVKRMITPDTSRPDETSLAICDGCVKICQNIIAADKRFVICRPVDDQPCIEAMP